jgi:cyclohexyl-isocyanide hydratase
MLRGDEIAEVIQLQMQYAPEPPFKSGTPETAPAAIAAAAREIVAAMTTQREETAKRIAKRLGVSASA